MSKLKEFQRLSRSNYSELLTLDIVISSLNTYASNTNNERRAWKLMILYREALGESLTLSMFIKTDEEGADDIIFEGFEVVEEDTNKNHIVINDHNDNTIWFWISGKRKGWIEIDFWQRVFTLNGLSKLTVDNPLKLTKCNPN